MSEAPPPAPGSIGWVDLTVDDAPGIRDFYAAVVGWKPMEVSMGDDSDYNMTRPDGAPAAGVCHSRGANLGLPAQWVVYAVVEDLDRSMSECVARGGEVIHGPRGFGGTARFCVVRDPAGAVLGLYDPGRA